MSEGIGTPMCELSICPIQSGKNKGWFKVTVGERQRTFSGSNRAAAFAAADQAIATDLGLALPAKTRTATQPVAKARGRTRKTAMAGT